MSIPDGKAENIPVEIDVKLEMGPRLEFEYPISDKEEAIATQIRDGVPSPDGKWLAFTVLNKLYIKELPDGSPEGLPKIHISKPSHHGLPMEKPSFMLLGMKIQAGTSIQ